MGIFSRRRVEHRFVARGALEAPAGFESLVTASVSCDGPVALWATPEARSALLELGGDDDAPFEQTQPRRVAVAIYAAETTRPTSVAFIEVPFAYPLVQTLPGGEILVVGARCSWSPEGAEHNALVFGIDGTLRRSGTLGDGIEHVLADAAGDIWVGYFDEGIFGNMGWGGPGPEPLGSMGIVKWSSTFERSWTYQPVDKFWLADCYALNVASDRVWACPYTDFPVLEIHRGRTTVRPTVDVSGPRGIVVAGESVGLIGDYSDPGALRIGPLAGSLDRLPKHTLGMPDGGKLVPGELICRGSTATMFVDEKWYSFDLNDAI